LGDYPVQRTGVNLNNIQLFSRRLADLWKIDSEEAFHKYAINHALSCYQQKVGEQGLGNVLAVCANFQEARYFKSFPFTEIVLTGFEDRKDEVQEAAGGDPRISYQEQNCEALPFASQSFDLVFCKEGLHHLARPVLGLYEMLRVCRKAVVFIEPCDTPLSRLLESMRIATIYERSPPGNPHGRDNYVFRWNRRQLESILNSYYLDSGYCVEMYLGWLSQRANTHPSKVVRRLSALCGRALSTMPWSRGNMMTALILPGENIPKDAVSFSLKRQGASI
jgi:SAM-dependent methyltransferase